MTTIVHPELMLRFSYDESQAAAIASLLLPIMAHCNSADAVAGMAVAIAQLVWEQMQERPYWSDEDSAIMSGHILERMVEAMFVAGRANIVRVH